MPRVHPKTYFKFLHGATWRKILGGGGGGGGGGGRPTTKPFCNVCRKVETQAHAFFECDEAYAIWREIKPKLSEILDGENVQCSKIALKAFPDKTTPNQKKLLLTLVQIAMHQIWLNRKHEKIQQNTQTSLNSIDRSFTKNIKRCFGTYATEDNLKLFSQRFCMALSICRVDDDGKLHVGIL